MFFLGSEFHALGIHDERLVEFPLKNLLSLLTLFAESLVNKRATSFHDEFKQRRLLPLPKCFTHSAENSSLAKRSSFV